MVVLGRARCWLILRGWDGLGVGIMFWRDEVSTSLDLVSAFACLGKELGLGDSLQRRADTWVLELLLVLDVSTVRLS